MSNQEAIRYLQACMRNPITRRLILKHGRNFLIAAAAAPTALAFAQTTAQAAEPEDIIIHYDERSALYTVGANNIAQPKLAITFTVPEALTGKIQWSVLARDSAPVGEGVADFSVTGGSAQTVTIPLGTFSPDFYRVNAKVLDSADAILKETGIGLGVLYPQPEGLRPDSVFALGMRDEGDLEVDRKIANQMGVRWVRGGIRGTDPPIVGPAPGVFWGEAEIQTARQQVMDWRNAGILNLGYVNYNMDWNIMPLPDGTIPPRHANRPDDLMAQAQMVYHMIKPLQDLVTNWEIWNEPWIHSWTWATGDAQDYRDMAKMIWDLVKPEFPDVNLIGGGSVAYQRDIVYAKNSKDIGYIDGSVSHAYGNPDPNQFATTRIQVEMDKRWSQSQGRAGLWQTELGTGPFMYEDLPEVDRLYAVARTLAPTHLLHMLGAGNVPIKIFWFALSYDAGYSGGEFNMYNPDTRTPHPVVVAYSIMTHFLEDCTLEEELFPQAKSTWGFVFKHKDGSARGALYADQIYENGTYSKQDAGYKGKVSFNNMHGIKVFDYLGKSLVDGTKNRVTLDIEPWETLYFVTDRSTEELKKVLKDGVYVYNRPLFITPLSFLRPISAGRSKNTIEVLVENVTPNTVNVMLNVQAPEGWVFAPPVRQIHGLKAGEKRVISFPAVFAKTNADNRYPVNYEAIITGLPGSGAIKQKGTQVIQVAAAPYKTITIDGTLDDWQDIVPTTIQKKTAAGVDVTYKSYTAWDDQYFYFAAQIPDYVQSSNKPFSEDPYGFAFLADSIQLAFNILERSPDDLLWGDPHYEKACAADMDHLYVATLNSAGNPELHRQCAPGTNYQTYYPTNGDTTPPLGVMNVTPEGGTEGKMQIVHDDVNRQTVYEIAIAWDQLPELKERLTQLKDGEVREEKFAYSVNDVGEQALWGSYWTAEAGLLQSGTYNFAPFWGTGHQNAGGRVITRWGFYR